MNHPITWKQYAEQVYRELRQMTGAEPAACRECIPFHRPNWQRGVVDYAKHGGKFRASFLNTLEPRFVLELASYSDCLPAGYVCADVRQTA